MLKYKNKIIVFLLLATSNVYANNKQDGNIFFKIKDAIDKSDVSTDFYYFLRIIGFLLFMYALYNGFVNDSTQKTGQQKTWNAILLFTGSMVLLNFRRFLEVLASV